MAVRLLSVLVVACLLLSGHSATPGVSAQDEVEDQAPVTVNVEFVLDSSGSMAAFTTEGEVRMDAAKRVLREVVASIPDRSGQINVGFRVYGHEGDNSDAAKELSCKASDLLVPVDGIDRDALNQAIDATQPTGWTPIARAIGRASKDFPESDGDAVNVVVLLTDGVETCDGQPAKTAAKLRKQKGLEMITHVVGFGTTPEEQLILAEIAEGGGGLLFGAGNATELRSALFAILEELQIVVGAGYVGGNAFSLLPEGEPGELAVLGYGPVDPTTSQLPFVLRNNTGADIVGPKVSVTVRDGAGSLLGAGDALLVSPFFVRSGGLAFGYVYFGTETTFPPDAVYDFKATSTTPRDARFQTTADLDIVEASLFPDRIAGTIKNGYDNAVKGPFTYSVLCLDANGGVLSQAIGFSNTPELASGETLSFQVDLFLQNYSGGGCPLFLVAGHGFGKPRSLKPETTVNTSRVTPEATAEGDTSEAEDDGSEPVGACATDDLAEQVVLGLKESGLPIGDYEVYTAETDPNELLGRPNGYAAKVNFRDTTLVLESTTFETSDGGSVEVFEEEKLAQNRLEHIQAIGQEVPALIEYDYVMGGVLLRLSKRLVPDQAAAYEEALNDLTGCS